MKTYVAAGFTAWHAPKRTWGTSPYSISEVGQNDPAEYEVYSVQNLGDFAGATYCSDGVLILDFRKSNGSLVYANSMKGIAAHEMGHAIGLSHTGYQDSFYHSAEAPTMEAGPACTPMQATPIWTWPDHLNTLEDDDYAAAINQLDPSYSANPNPSFENGYIGWTKSAGTWSIPATGAPYGSRYMTFTGGNAYLSNRVRLWDPGNQVTYDHYRTRLRYKEAWLQTGSIRVELWRRGLSPSSVASTNQYCDGQFYDATLNLNYPNPGGWSRISAATWDENPGTSWSALRDGQWVTVGAHADLEIRIYNFTQDQYFNGGTIDIDTAYLDQR